MDDALAGPSLMFPRQPLKEREARLRARRLARSQAANRTPVPSEKIEEEAREAMKQNGQTAKNRGKPRNVPRIQEEKGFCHLVPVVPAPPGPRPPLHVTLE